MKRYILSVLIPVLVVTAGSFVCHFDSAGLAHSGPGTGGFYFTAWPMSPETPWIIVFFDDSGTDQVTITVTAPHLGVQRGEDGTGFWEQLGSLYLNIDPALENQLSNLTFTIVSAPGAPVNATVTRQVNSIRDGGGAFGLFDIALPFALGRGQQISYRITGATGLSTSSFDFMVKNTADPGRWGYSDFRILAEVVRLTQFKGSDMGVPVGEHPYYLVATSHPFSINTERQGLKSMNWSQGGVFQMALTGIVGHRFDVFRSEDVRSGWALWQSLVLTNRPQTVLDTDAGRGARFYMAERVP